MPHFRNLSRAVEPHQENWNSGTSFSLHSVDTPRGFTLGDGAHDGFPGGRPSRTEVHGTGGDDDINHFEVGFGQSLYGFAGDDTIVAGYANDEIFGGLGHDEILANAGDDLVVGGAGNDFLSGDAGNDSLHAGEGIDSVFGGSGDDFIFLVDDGQTDTVYFQKGEDTDVIDNFEQGVDKIALANFGITSFDALEHLISYAGDQAMIDFGEGDVLIFTNLEGPLEASDFLI